MTKSQARKLLRAVVDQHLDLFFDNAAEAGEATNDMTALDHVQAFAAYIESSDEEELASDAEDMIDG